VICVPDNLFNGFGSEESADHRISSARVEGEWRNAIDKFLFHMVASIAGQPRRSAERDESVWSILFNQTNQIDQINKRDHPGHTFRSVARAARRKASNIFR
jgi:hypothetical protein